MEQTNEEKKNEGPKIETKVENGPPQLDAQEKKRLQAMLGAPKSQEAVYIGNEKNEKKALNSHPPQATIYFINCHDSEYHVDSLSTKILIEKCTNCKFYFNAKIVTSLLDVFKCQNLDIGINTSIGTLQLDVSQNLNVEYKSSDLLNTVVWANVHDLDLKFVDKPEHNSKHGFAIEQQKNPTIKQELDQFIIRFVKDSLLCEQIVRLDNGFPTTEREAKEFDRRQEENLQKLAQNIGITIGKKKATGPKVKPNDPCHCGSGKKFKKCHGTNA
eukprot:TRINITY_DN751_c0_g3_i2.p1 TRINITY_DN751_c0_g3~~TRINITY_DN751_c0_g3_i2.p1  ORF type:complete len:272 (+),score=81.59 TRINITY_DN751_c0_g3_i2:183-998(+)